MSTYLLCYEIQVSNGNVSGGYSFLDVSALTKTTLMDAETLIMADMKMKNPNLSFVSLSWRSVTKLDNPT